MYQCLKNRVVTIGQIASLSFVFYYANTLGQVKKNDILLHCAISSHK